MKVRIDRALKRETFVDSMRQDDASRRRALEALRRTKPAVVVCYTQSCAQFARWITDNRLRDWDDVPVLCGAEAVLPADRAGHHARLRPARLRDVRLPRDDAPRGRVRSARRHAPDGREHAGRGGARRSSGRGRRGRRRPRDGSPQLRHAVHPLPERRRRAHGRVRARARAVEACASSSASTGVGRTSCATRAGNPIPGIVFHVLFSDARQARSCGSSRPCSSRDGEVTLRVVRGQDWSPGPVRRRRPALRRIPAGVALPHRARDGHRSLRDGQDAHDRRRAVKCRPRMSACCTHAD